MVPVGKVSPFDIKSELLLQLGDIYGISALSFDNKQAKYMINTTCSTCGTESTYPTKHLRSTLLCGLLRVAKLLVFLYVFGMLTFLFSRCFSNDVFCFSIYLVYFVYIVFSLTLMRINNYSHSLRYVCLLMFVFSNQCSQ